jgi:NADPH-dependent ferric siderophore reductase
MTVQEQSVARPENFRVAKVMHTRRVTPQMQRVTVQVDDLSRFDCAPRSLGPHVHALIPRQDRKEPGWPTVDEKGHAVYPPFDERPAVRTYSVRRFDHAENSLDIDFVLHGEGVASAWAERASVGAEIGLWRPHARILEEEPERYLLAGDHTALPAIAFILDHLPEDAQGDVIVMVPDQVEEQPLRLPNRMRLRWLHASLEARSDNMLPAAVRALDPQDIRASFVWVGAEAAAARDIRAFARKECRLPASRTYILNYWKRGMVEGTYDHGE